MVNGEALQLALALLGQPARSAELRARPLPGGITEVLRIASGNAASIASAAQRSGVAPETLMDAARFYVEQQLLARECERDPWRVLGVSPAADPELIRDHRRLLVSLVHPDRGEDWAAAFSDRVNRAWRELKSPEGRAAAVERSTESVRREAWSAELDADAFRAGREGRVGEPAGDDPDDLWAPVANPEAQAGAGPADVQWPLSRLPGDAQPRPPHRGVSRAATAGGLAFVACALALLAWNLMGTHGLGDEVLVPMAEVSRPAVGLRGGQPGRNPSVPPGEAVAVDNPAAGPAAAVPAASPSVSAAPRNEGDPSRVDSQSNVLVVKSEEPANRAPRTSSSLPALSSASSPTPVSLPASDPVQARQEVAGGPSSGGPESAAGAVGLPGNHGLGRSDDHQFRSGEPFLAADSEVQAPGELPAGSGSIRPLAPDAVSVAETGLAIRPDAGSISELTEAIDQDPGAVAEVGGRGPQATAAAAHPSSPPLDIRRAASDQGETEAGGALPPSPWPRGLSSDLATDLLHQFSQHYASGDLGALVGLFSSQANSARGGTMALAADYARLFEGTSDREFSVRDLRWRLDGELLRGEGRFEARYYRKGRLFRQVVKGEISFVMVAENGSTRILRLDSRPDGRRA